MALKCLYEIQEGQCLMELFDVSEEIGQTAYNLLLFVQNISGGIYVTAIIFTIAIVITYLMWSVRKAILLAKT